MFFKRYLPLLLLVFLNACDMLEPGSGAKAKKRRATVEINESAASSCTGDDTSVQVFYRNHFADDGESCQEVYQSAVCDNGVWRFPDSGVTLYSFCIERESVFPASTVSYPQECEKSHMRERTCKSGSCGAWQGQTGFTECEQLAAADCEGTPHGELKVIGYDTAVLLNGESCQTKKVQASCDNGQWKSLTWEQGDPLFANCYDENTDLGGLFNFLNNCQVDNSAFGSDEGVTSYLAACFEEYKKSFFYTVND